MEAEILSFPSPNRPMHTGLKKFFHGLLFLCFAFIYLFLSLLFSVYKIFINIRFLNGYAAYLLSFSCLKDENKNKGPTDTSFMLGVTFYDADKYKWCCILFWMCLMYLSKGLVFLSSWLSGWKLGMWKRGISKCLHGEILMRYSWAVDGRLRSTIF